MAQALHWTREGERLSLTGELENETLLPLWDARQQAVNGVTTLDLAGLTRVDTAGLALILHLRELASREGSPVNVVGMSDNFTSLVQLYNLPGALFPSANS